MKSVHSHRRTTVRSPQLKQHRLRAQHGNGHGNGDVASDKAKPRISPAITAWLGRPKCNLIAGRWVPSATGKVFDVFNPADGSVLACVPDSDREDINRAVAAARHAFEAGPWRRMTSSDRGRMLGISVI